MNATRQTLRTVLVAVSVFYLTACFQSHDLRNAPGRTVLNAPVNWGRAHRTEVPEDPGERVFVFQPRLMFGANLSKWVSKSANVSYIGGVEAVSHVIALDKSHHDHVRALNVSRLEFVLGFPMLRAVVARHSVDDGEQTKPAVLLQSHAEVRYREVFGLGRATGGAGVLWGWNKASIGAQATGCLGFIMLDLCVRGEAVVPWGPGFSLFLSMNFLEWSHFWSR